MRAPTIGTAGVDNPQLVAAAVDVAELLLDLSLELELDFSLEPDFSLESLDPESLDEEPLVELDDFLPDSRLSVR
ncbi:hypothetical protein A5625_09665 [Mycobacterium sp. 1465703.0]|nr:hypothetical protein A5625_09665 [Mycobacterium sp. 1465703.0]